MRALAPRALFVGALLFSVCLPCRATEPNDTFAQRTILNPGELTVTDDLSPGTGSAPDTLLGVFDAGGFDPFENIVAENDDDGSTLGDVTASGVTGVAVNADGSINFVVTGTGDFFYEGEHEEAGGYKAFVEVFDSGGAPVDEFSVVNTLQPGVADVYPMTNPAWLGGTFSINIDNTIDGFTGGDVDFFTFTGLNPGSTFSAETSSPGTIDTMLGQYSDAGALLQLDDDSGAGVLSLLEGTIPASGQLTFAVTGSGDDTFVGQHAQQEVYDLVLTIDGVTVPGDFDGSGTVDGTDLTHPTLGWEARYGNDLHGKDYLTWQEAFAGGSPALAAVPEPTVFVHLLMGAGFWAWGIRRVPLP